MQIKWVIVLDCVMGILMAVLMFADAGHWSGVRDVFVWLVGGIIVVASLYLLKCLLDFIGNWFLCSLEISRAFLELSLEAGFVGLALYVILWAIASPFMILVPALIGFFGAINRYDTQRAERDADFAEMTFGIDRKHVIAQKYDWISNDEKAICYSKNFEAAFLSIFLILMLTAIVFFPLKSLENRQLWIGIALLGIMAAFAIFNLFKSRALFVLGESGIIDKHHSDFFAPWVDIVGFDIQTNENGDKYIVVNVADPERYAGEIVYRKSLLEKFSSPVAIPLKRAEIDPDRLLILCDLYLKKYGVTTKK